MNLFVVGIGVLGPGLNGWPATRSILAGTDPHVVHPTIKPVPDILPATERRRSSEAVRLAVKVGEEAMTMSGLPGHEIASVFASSDGDGDITHKICESLASQDRDISPTLFHNSVYNAPAGYWSIATGSRLGSTSLCAYDASFAAGLLEAAAQATVEHQAVLLVCYDLPFPGPLHAVRSVDYSFAAAFVLTPFNRGTPLMRWGIELASQRASTEAPATIDRALHNNPASQCLPLLAALESGRSQSIALAYLDDQSLVVNCEAYHASRCC